MQTKRTFYKFHGAGNDFIIVRPQFFGLSNNRTLEKTYSENDQKIIIPGVIQLCDRHFGIGADGVLIVSQVQNMFKMSIYNSDGTLGANCGNGLRCVALFLFLYKNVGTDFTIATDSGPMLISLCQTASDEASVQIMMGQSPKYEQVPLFLGSFAPNPNLLQHASIYSLQLGNKQLVVIVSPYNFAQMARLNAYEPYAAALRKIYKQNVNFCVVRSRTEIDLITSEFGNGVTLACGTGSTATAFIAWATGETQRQMRVKVKGGSLTITVKESQSGNILLMKGPAKLVYVGSL